MTRIGREPGRNDPCPCQSGLNTKSVTVAERRDWLNPTAPTSPPQPSCPL
ncbi:SEC-C metal-binding domain-containing protein [Mesorhizobium sp. AaZ16]